jgi:hypothetical protein
MSDFYSVLKQSIIDRGLSAPESREEAYAQARRAMINRLWSYDPPLAEDEIDHRIGQFDTAVARIEDDVVEVFATMEAAAEAADTDDRRDEDDRRYAPPFGGSADAYGDDDGALPELGPVPSTLRAIEERSLAVERALSEIDDGTVEPAPRETAAYDADLAGWPGSGPEMDDHDAGDFADDMPVAPAPTIPPRPASPRAKAPQTPKAAPGPRAPAVKGVANTASWSMPAWRPSNLHILIGIVAILALILVGGLAWLLLPRGTPTADTPVVLQTDVPSGVSDPDTAIRLPKEAITVTSSFSLFDGKDPTVFAGDPDNPVRFDGENARISTSASSAGAKVIIGAGLSSRLAGKTVRVTIDARSARENGATSMRFAYQSGVAISHWQTANLSSEFTELGLVWRVPTLRTNPIGDFIIIEPGIPGSGTGVEIRSVRIDLVDG